jgi:hypothetical protein
MFTSIASVADAHQYRPPPSIADQHFAEPAMAPRALDRATIRARLAAARGRNLAAFRAYQKNGVFPSNTFQPNKLNVWRDADGHLCAAATIIAQSGEHDLVRRVAEQNNFIRLGDVKQGPLMDWILMSGFTQDEIAAIQEPFSPVTNPQRREQPTDPVVVDAKLRAAEDARLRARYAVVTKMLVDNQQKSLDLATDRIMQHPGLAWKLTDAPSSDSAL